MTNSLGTLLRTARKAKGFTQEQVGAHAGITYSAVGQYETGSIKKPKPEKLAAIADMLGIAREDLNGAISESYGFTLEGADPTPEVAAARRAPLAGSQALPEVVLDKTAPTLAGASGPRNVPELGIAVGGEDGDFTLNGEALDYVPRPAALATRDVFALRVKNESMVPRFDEGHLLYIERKREPRVGEDGIIELWPEEEGGAGKAFIKQIKSKDSVRIVARQFNPAKDITFERSKVKALYRVVPNNELFGV